jgi:stalled ribosome alternative rescue factor ArfA
VRFLQSSVLGKSVTAALIGGFNMKKIAKLKMEKAELQEYLMFKHRGSKVEAKKGKGSSYNRKAERKIPKEF